MHMYIMQPNWAVLIHRRVLTKKLENYYKTNNYQAFKKV